MHEPSSKDNYEYDIALSFAGEERFYVEIVAKELKNNDIKVFYDEYEKVDMWGKNLHDHLADVYSNKALYCIIFISQNYANKVWTNHERRSAQSRAIRQKQEYILPARFDDTEIIGLDDVTYIDLMEYTAYEFAELVIKKLGTSDKNQLSSRLREYVPKSVKFNYKLDFHDLKILEGFLDSRFRYRAISKISNDVAMEEGILRKRLNFLNNKGLVDIIARPKGNKWAITNDGKEYIDYYYHDLDESSDSFYFGD